MMGGGSLRWSALQLIQTKQPFQIGSSKSRTKNTEESSVTGSIHDEIQLELAKLRDRVDEMQLQLDTARQRQYLPVPPFPDLSPSTPFMSYSTCNAGDILHPRYQEICDLLKHPFMWHRKMWEWVFIIHHLVESGLVKSGSRGLVFGVGIERLPSLFASMGAKIVALTRRPNMPRQRVGRTPASTQPICKRYATRK